MYVTTKVNQRTIQFHGDVQYHCPIIVSKTKCHFKIELKAKDTGPVVYLEDTKHSQPAPGGDEPLSSSALHAACTKRREWRRKTFAILSVVRPVKSSPLKKMKEQNHHDGIILLLLPAPIRQDP